MSPNKQTEQEIRENLYEQLEWQVAQRDDEQIAHLLHAGEKMEGVHTLDEAGLLDEFFAFLEKSQVLAFWKRYEISAIQRIFQPTIYFLLLYGTRLLFGIHSTNALPDLLFSNVAVMALIGFNARQVSSGMTKRGSQARKEDSPYVLMDPQTLADTICKSSLQELEKLFNGTISCLAKYGIFMAEMMVAIDGTQIETTAKFADCGCQKVTEWKTNRKGIKVEVIKLVYGWRLIALIDLTTLIPIAIKIVQIQQSESPFLIELVKQAQANFAHEQHECAYSRIVTLVADRSYIDGAGLYELDQMGIRFVLIAKKNMVAYGTALSNSVESDYYERIETVRRGQGRDQETETLRTRLQIATDIRTWESYRPPKADGEQLRIKDRPALNAVIVRIWNNKELDTPRVFLTNKTVDDPWYIFNLYDDRSWIENGLFRNSKQFFNLTQWFPKKNEAGVHTHITFVMLITAVATAFRLWSKAHSTDIDQHEVPQQLFTFRTIHRNSGPVHDDEQTHNPSQHLAATYPETDSSPTYSHHLLLGQGPARWRQELKRHNRDKLIVFFGDKYGIFDLPVFMALTCVPIHLPPEYGTHDDILSLYNIRIE